MRFIVLAARFSRPSFAKLLVTTGLDPVVHAELRF
jgi:hypothetical protein